MNQILEQNQKNCKTDYIQKNKDILVQQEQQLQIENTTYLINNQNQNIDQIHQQQYDQQQNQQKQQNQQQQQPENKQAEIKKYCNKYDDLEKYNQIIQKQFQKFILVCGGVASGIGTGMIIGALGSLLKNSGYKVSLIKVDPYLNKDASFFSSSEQGEIYVLDDGGEVDTDFGNYERFIDINFQKSHSITSGKIYSNVIEKEREGYYLGSTVQFIPHVVDEIKQQIFKTSLIPMDGSTDQPEIVLLELGGTVGDFESIFFFESIRQLQLDYGKQNICVILVSYVPQFNQIEFKTKPTQNAIKVFLKIVYKYNYFQKGLNYAGLNPDIIILRSSEAICSANRQKIAKFANIRSYQVLNIPDYEQIFEVPLILHEQVVTNIIQQRLQLPVKPASTSFHKIMTRYCNDIINTPQTQTVKIGFIGEYVKYNTEPYFSVKKALEGASYKICCKIEIIQIDPQFLQGYQQVKKLILIKFIIKNTQGIYLADGNGYTAFEGAIIAANYARENNIPCFGVQFGFQVMAIEFARNVLQISDANSQVFEDTIQSENFIFNILEKIIKLENKEMQDNEDSQQTLVLGSRITIISDTNSLTYKIYGKQEIQERHKDRIIFNTKYLELFENNNFKFTGKQQLDQYKVNRHTVNIQIIQSFIQKKKNQKKIQEYQNNRFHIGTQFYPEYGQSYYNPSKIYCAFLEEILGKLTQNIEKHKVYQFQTMEQIEEKLKLFEFQKNLEKKIKQLREELVIEKKQNEENITSGIFYLLQYLFILILESASTIGRSLCQNKIKLNDFIQQKSSQILNWVYLGSKLNANDLKVYNQYLIYLNLKKGIKINQKYQIHFKLYL
ncbi:hypothetical protein IMG5_051090 [Ichthyophthirius multifiliis]|uniref:CTP synthase n=1 Tax=Ichthyophthirius multifiliis TaxID=5932 RepID=G0QMQ6_ICHMU|nr:hypothetical protein IMG5_051090 [Ichthyophthirius multifiliis]EGR33512.1 hypothetical protein IMG5_051090 [Ichthyophthirius multifiliis]|eukprot:XP_004037498.1 hypothetical protein IMG5_051090 [Ichthyophthirius multifiliis]